MGYFGLLNQPVLMSKYGSNFSIPYLTHIFILFISVFYLFLEISVWDECQKQTFFFQNFALGFLFLTRSMDEDL